MKDTEPEGRSGEMAAQSEERLALALQGAADGVWDWNLDSGQAYFDRRCAEMLGFESFELGNSINSWEKLVHPEDAAQVAYELARHLNGESESFYAEMRLLTRDEQWRWVMYRGQLVERNQHHTPLRMVGTQTDIDRQKKKEISLQEQARTDSLTRLPNRLYFQEHLRAVLSLSMRNQRSCAVAYLDLDGFKTVNDRFGHTVGDEILTTFASRTSAILRGEDMIARVGGDEFCIVLHEVNQPHEAAAVMQRVLAALTEPVHSQGFEVVVGASIGIAIYPQDADTVDQLVQRADEAMFEAKKSGSNRFVFHQQVNPEKTAALLPACSHGRSCLAGLTEIVSG